MKRRVLSVLLALSMICSIILAIPAYADTNTTSGKCGYNVYWTLDNAGTLTITGTGKMDDYKAPPTSQASPFLYDKNIKNIIIEGGVTYIGNYAFAGCENLSSVTLLPGVEEIGNWSFFACKNLKSVTLPKTINRIGAAFVNCYELSNITLPASLQFIGDCAFQHTNISSIVIPQGVERIEYATFAYCNNLKAISIPKSVTTFGLSAFLDCNNLTDVYYEGSADEWNKIGNNADVITYTSFTPSYGDYGNSDARNAYLHYNGYIKVLLNGQPISFSYPPIVKDGRTLVPLRAIFEAMGAMVDWDGNTQTVTSTLEETTVKLTIGSNILYRNGEAKTLDVPAQIINGYTMVPARAVAEAFGAKVDWDGATQTVYITTSTEKNITALLLAGYDDSDKQREHLEANRLSVDYVEDALENLNVHNIKKYYMEDDQKYMSDRELTELLKNSFNNSTDTDISIIYYSGHSFYYYDKNRAEQHVTAFSSITFQSFYDIVKNNTKGTVLLIYDGCYAGELMNLKNYDDRIKIVGACDEDDYSSSYYLSELDSSSNEKRICSIFAYALKNGVENNIHYLDSNSDSVIAFDELYIYMLNSVFNICDRLTTENNSLNRLKDMLGMENVIRLAQIVQYYPNNDSTPLFELK